MATVVILALAAPAHALDIASTGAWTLSITSSDLSAGAGSDLVTTHDSAGDAVAVDVSGAVGSGDSWRVDVRRTDTTWDGDLRVWVLRTSAGTGSGSISGGTGWVEVTAFDQSFFSGAGDRADVAVQLRVTGMSVGVAPDLLGTQVTLTVVDL